MQFDQHFGSSLTEHGLCCWGLIERAMARTRQPLPSGKAQRIMSDPAIVLDPVIRDWVLLPLTAIIILAQLLRTIIIMVMQKPTNKSADELAQR